MVTDDDVHENQGKSGRERKLFPVTSLIKIMTSNHRIGCVTMMCLKCFSW